MENSKSSQKKERTRVYGILQAGVALTFSSESSSVEIPRSPQVGHRHRKYYKTPRSPHIPYMDTFISWQEKWVSHLIIIIIILILLIIISAIISWQEKWVWAYRTSYVSLGWKDPRSPAGFFYISLHLVWLCLRTCACLLLYILYKTYFFTSLNLALI